MNNKRNSNANKRYNYESRKEGNYDDSMQRSGRNKRNDGRQKSEKNNSSGNYYGYSPRSDNHKSADGLIIHVLKKHVGRIIGRGGCKIRELEYESGAKINIDKSSYDDATVTLTGSSDAQQKAKNLIVNLTMNESSSNYEKNQQFSTVSSNLNDGNYAQSNDQQQVYQNYEPSQAQTWQSSQDERDPLDFGDFDWTKANADHEKFQKERWGHLKPLKKNFYNESLMVAKLSAEEVADIRKSKNNIECRRVFETTEKQTTQTFTIPNPVLTFDQAFHDYPEILEEIHKQNFTEPSPIQCQAWPILLSGKDLIGIAQTGTGKTLAFLLPALIHIDGQPTPREERVGPNVLIMAPTRELALQIHKEVQKYEYHGIKAVCIYGGGSRKEQVASIDKGVNIVIATPGRLNDLIADEKLNVNEVSYLVLDEADRMLDMGFEPQIRKALIDVRPDRQTVMTSATWPQGVQRLAQSYMSDPIQVHVGSLDLAAVHTVRQVIIFTNDDEKRSILLDFFLHMNKDDKVIVFFGKKSRVDDLASELALAGVNVQSIHGGREQLDREQALEDLRTGEVKILLATDVASRGIDIEDITYVFNYDFPRDIEEYVHRVGRTGRAGRSGESISLLTRGDWGLAKELIAILEEASQEVPQELYEMAQKHDAYKKRRAQEKNLTDLDASGGRYGGRGGSIGSGGNYRGNSRRNNYNSGFY